MKDMRRNGGRRTERRRNSKNLLNKNNGIYYISNVIVFRHLLFIANSFIIASKDILAREIKYPNFYNFFF